MASSSHRRSDSSGRSSQRRKVHVGTGTTSRKASSHPHTMLENAEAGQARGAGHRAPTGTRKSAAPAVASEAVARRERAPRRTPSAKQIEREQKRAVERRLFRRRAAVVAAVLAVLLLTRSAIVNSQVFEIESVDITGVAALSVEDVIRRAAIEQGETLLRVDTDAVVERLLEDPWIQDASISRRLPSTLRIEVTERVPAAVVDTGVSFWFVEKGGRVIAESVASSATAVPVIRDVPDFVAEPGEVSESAALRNALAVLSGLSDELRATIRSITAPSVSETTLLTATGVEITVGEAVNMDEKSVIISDILAAQGANVVFIDVRSIERPISRGLGE